MKRCRRCGTENIDDKRWCSKCMKPLVETADFRNEKAKSPEAARNRADTPSKLREKMGGEPLSERYTVPERIPKEKAKKTSGVLHCPMCGEVNHKEDNYCTNCGSVLGKMAGRRSWWIPVTAVCIVIALLIGFVPIITGSSGNQYSQNDLAAVRKVSIENAKDAITEMKKSADEYG